MTSFFSFLSPGFQRIVDALKAELHGKRLTLRHDPKLVFLCGKGFLLDRLDDSNRHLIIEYARKYLTDYRFFLAEDLMNYLLEVNDDGMPDFMSIEAIFAQVSDCVIVIMESMGAAAELGAFSLHEHLRKKILVLNDIKYKKDQSFINLGPLKLVGKQSDFGEPIFRDLSFILDFMPEVENRLSSIPSCNIIKLPILDDKLIPSHLKQLLYMMTDLIRLTGPLTIQNIVEITRLIIGNVKDSLIYSLLSVAIGIRFIVKYSRGGTNIYYAGDGGISNDCFCAMEKMKFNALRSAVISRRMKFGFPPLLPTKIERH